MKKANVRISVSGIKNSLMHLEARKPETHPNETLFITWCKVSDNQYHYAWQLMHRGEIKSADCSARTVSHDELADNVQSLIENTFIDNTFKHVDQTDYYLVD